MLVQRNIRVAFAAPLGSKLIMISAPASFEYFGNISICSFADLDIWLFVDFPTPSRTGPLLTFTLVVGTSLLLGHCLVGQKWLRRGLCRLYGRLCRRLRQPLYLLELNLPKLDYVVLRILRVLEFLVVLDALNEG